MLSVDQTHTHDANRQQHEAMLARRERLEHEAATLRERADELRDDLNDLERNVNHLESEVASIDKQLRVHGLLYRPEDVEQWGVEVARAIYDSGLTACFRMLDGDWLSNGQLAWRVASTPATSSGIERFGAELLGERYAIRLDTPVGIGERSTERSFHDFESSIGLVRFDEFYWRAVQAAGDEVAVVRVPSQRQSGVRGAEGSLCLVAFRAGAPSAVAMPISMDSPSRPIESEATP